VIQAIIIDDSQNSIDALQLKLSRHCPTIKVVYTCTEPAEAINAISFYRPDLLFLDIEMPLLNGFSLLKEVPDLQCEIIFVTAYNQYAIEAIRSNAFDYLLKPVDVTQLKNSIENLERKIAAKLTADETDERPTLHQLRILLQSVEASARNFSVLSLPSADGIELVQPDDIAWLESISNYTRFHFTDGKEKTSSKTLGEYEELLRAKNFIRIHRSYVINLKYLLKYHRGDGGFVELKDGTRLEVSIRKKQELLNKLKDLSL
jgi:two-component system, LytTR family, response regulator